MKEKILPILKSAVKNSTFSERTFSEVAESISKAATTAGITDEKLETFVKDMLPVFTTFQGDANSQIAEAVKKEKAAKSEPVEPQPQKDPQPAKVEDGKQLTAADIAAIVAEANKPLLDKINLLETGSQRSALIQSAKKQMVEQYNIDEKLCDKVINRIDITLETTAEDLAKNAIQEYNELASSFGKGQIEEGLPNAGGASKVPTQSEIDAILNIM